MSPLSAADDVGHRHVEPLALADDRRRSPPCSPAFSHHCCASITAISSALVGVRILVDPVGAHAERLLRMLEPDLAGRAGGEADALVDELLVPRLADAEGVHVADLHVRHHLRRRHDDGRDVLVGVDAAGGDPVADPQVVGAAGEGHRDLHFLAVGLLLLEGGLERRGVGGDLEVLVFVGDRDRLGVEIEARQQVHRRRHVVLRHLAGRDQVGHRRQDVRAVDAVLLGAEHEVVARRAPGRLLGDVDIGHAVLGEEALLLGDDQRRGVDQRDVAEDRLGHLRPGRLRDMHAAGKFRLHGAEQRRGAGTGLEKRAAADRRFLRRSQIFRVSGGHLARSSSRNSSVLAALSLRAAQSAGKQKAAPQALEASVPQGGGVAYRPASDLRRRRQ